MNFKEFLLNEEQFSNLEIAQMYFSNSEPIRSLSAKTNKSIPEIYRIVRNYGKPDRMNLERHNLARHLLSSGMNSNSIADFTNYSPRHILNLRKRYANNINRL